MSSTLASSGLFLISKKVFGKWVPGRFGVYRESLAARPVTTADMVCLILIFRQCCIYPTFGYSVKGDIFRAHPSVNGTAFAGCALPRIGLLSTERTLALLR